MSLRHRFIFAAAAVAFAAAGVLCPEPHLRRRATPPPTEAEKGEVIEVLLVRIGHCSNSSPRGRVGEEGPQEWGSGVTAVTSDRGPRAEMLYRSRPWGRSRSPSEVFVASTSRREMTTRRSRRVAAKERKRSAVPGREAFSVAPGEPRKQLTYAYKARAAARGRQRPLLNGGEQAAASIACFRSSTASDGGRIRS